MSKDNDKSGFLLSPAATSGLSLSWLLQILGLTFAYFITGKIGSYLAIPPGYATAIWPPSGIALASILIYGNRIWPGIFLGSFLINLSTSLLANIPTENFYSVVITLAIACGSSLQALVGAYLLKRFAGFPNLLNSEKQVFLFLLFGGIFSALINSTIAVSTLVAIGRIQVENFLINWGTWWMGDVLGIFIFTPLMIFWFQQPSESLRNRRYVITLPIITMFILTTTAVFYESQNDSKRLKLDFNRRALELALVFKNSVSSHMNVLHSLGGFYAASATINRQAFKVFVTQSLEDFQGIQALEWSPVILASERDEFEKSVRQDGYENFQITERDVNEKMVRAGNRSRYIPITFLEPYQGNESALGYDFNSSQERQEALDRARDTGDLAITSRVNLVQDKSKQHGLVAYRPIYRKGLPHQTLEDRRNNITGYVVGIFRVVDIITAALKNVNTDELSFRLIDESAPVTEQLLFPGGQSEMPLLVQQESGVFGRHVSLVKTLVLPVGGRSWRIEITPTQDYFAHHRFGNQWFILLAGLILTSLVGAFAMVSSGRGYLLRKLVEERTLELSQSEQRFRLVADAAPVLIWLAGTDKLYFWFNQIWLDFTGRSMEQETGNGWSDGVHPDDLLYCLAIYINHFDKREPFHMEYRLKRNDGEYRWLDDHGVPRFDTNGVFTGYIGSCVDITEIRQIQNELQASHDQFTALSRQVPGMVYQFRLFPDGHCSFPFASDNIKDIYELTPEQVSVDAAQVFTIFHPDDYDLIVSNFKSSADTLLPWQMEYRVNLPVKGLRWLSSMAQPELLNDGSVLWHGFITDITEQIVIRNEANKTKEALESVLSAATNISITSTDTQGVFTTFNRGAELMLGYSSEEIVGIRTPAIIHDQQEVSQRGQELTLELGRPVSGFEVFVKKTDQAGYEKREWTYIRKDQSTLTVSLAVTTIQDQNGEITGYLGIAEDITERKENEVVALLAKERAEALAQSKSEFLANMSHEIRTPMNSIIGLSYLALDKDIPDDVRDYLKKINNSANSLLSILNDILDFSKLEAERLTINQKAFILDEAIDNLGNLFAISAEEKGIDFNITVASDVPHNLIGDTFRLQQILINLLSNAIKFTNHGIVTLAITLRQIDQSQARLLFCVTDTGIGMSSNDYDKLFKPFSQVDSTITRRFGGTGLGLAISHNLLQLMGGEFLVTSIPGQGSTFSFELVLGVPVTSGEHNSKKHVLELADLNRLLVGTRILVAEDDIINQQVIQEFLALSGITVEMANNGQEALLLLETEEFDAVLMDIHMPVIDGFEATKLIRSQTRFARLPIIALTAGVTKKEQEQCLVAGMNDFIGKPINPEKLMSTLVQCLKLDELIALDIDIAEESLQNLLNINDLPVFDWRNLLLMLNNDQEHLTRLLLAFMENMKDMPDEIEIMISIGDFISAGQLLHKIKGTSGNIGAMRLHKASEALETELKEELSVAVFNTFKEVFNQTMFVIATQHLPEESLPSIGGNIEMLKHAAAELDDLLKENNFISDALLNSLKPYLAIDQLDLFSQLAKRINAFLYDEARDILRQLVELPDNK
ncbi:CHASE domain-containing protein [Methylobacter sp. S3L5C]|uniref:CHASE domain-containing protein n=1 Tax=Methylobacter sp. S3L5C TaxID=2839024 RepID=UPI001FADFDA5|nr:CHASE domain-containing protein [Methylobacter sp. S3L5C]UOA07224.1 CHASE domain-containing protein [Methylobacter sp. S3L5C]